MLLGSGRNRILDFGANASDYVSENAHYKWIPMRPTKSK